MPRGISHRVVLVGVQDGLLPALKSALQRRAARVAAICPDPTAASVEALAHPGETHLFIVSLAADADPARLGALTSVLPGQPVLVILAPGADLARVVAVQRAGAAQVVPLPWQPDDFLHALDCITTQFATPESASRIIAVCGVSGGCGATTIALNLAYELGLPGPGDESEAAAPGSQSRALEVSHTTPSEGSADSAFAPAASRKVSHTTRAEGFEDSAFTPAACDSCLLVELARQMGTLAAYLNIEPAVSTHELLGDASRLTTHGVRQALTSVGPGLDVLVGPYLDLSPATFSTRQVFQLVELCRRLATTVVLDVPCTFDDLQFETLALADQVVLVAVQSISSIRTLKLVRDTLEREEGIRGTRLVINRYEPTLTDFSAPRLAELLQAPQVRTVANDYPSVMAAVYRGKPLRLAAPHSRVLADIRALADSLQESSAAPSSAFSEEQKAAQGDRLARALGRGTSGPAPPRVVRVLHIEDDPVQQEVVAMHLAAIKELACTITPAASESEAVELFRQSCRTPRRPEGFEDSAFKAAACDFQPFDVVLLDYHLAQGNGLGCLKQLRQLDPIIPIVVVSGLEQPQVASDLLDAGADDFLSKQNLSGERLALCLTSAAARADACKQRQERAPRPGEPARFDAFVDRVRKTIGVRDESDLLDNLRELQENWPGQFSAGQIQRLVDLVCGELDGAPAEGVELPRRALLALFLRLFGGKPAARKEEETARG
jgi:Flp pilus assembly CpaE family ATPase